MEISARAYVFDEHDRVLLVKNSADQQWTLPGGHSEE
jgi:ADP-ribose pyrophosphatase YjhB (NUDIX family)